MNAVGKCGIQLYNYGCTISIPFFEDDWRPKSFYSKIVQNMNINLHTLCLLGLLISIFLDIKVKEPTLESLIKYLLYLTNRGKLVYMEPRYMTIRDAIEQIIEVDEDKICMLIFL